MSWLSLGTYSSRICHRVEWLGICARILRDGAFAGRTDIVPEMEFCTLYVVAQ